MIIEVHAAGAHLNQSYKENTVLLMAGGFGTRLTPLTDDCPKPLLKVGEKPIIQTIIENFIEYGLHKFVISTHYKSEMIQEYLGTGKNLGCSIEYLEEKSPLGKLVTPQDVANTVIFLASDFSHSINGENITVDTGMSCVQAW